MYVDKHYPREDIKVLIGDNLRAHMSPTVLRTCEDHNIRFMFLPENSTHILQPLDVSVFGPMKTRWRTILNDWKDECAASGDNHATIPKQVFPRLLKELLQKDFGPAIRSGFEASGLYPFNVRKAVSKLPQDIDEREVETQVVGTLVRQLDEMRHHAPANKQAPRPKKSDKLPAGAAYTCAPEGVASGSGNRPSGSGTSGSGARDREDDDDSSSSDSEDEQIQAIVDRLDEQHDDEEEEEEEELEDDPLPSADVHYPVDSFVVAVYQNKWYVAKVLDKDKEPGAEQGDEYILLSFMEQAADRNCFKWPEKKDILNTLKDDVIYKMKHPPSISGATSSRVSCAIAWTEFDRAKIAFRNFEAYYPTKISLYLVLVGTYRNLYFFSLSV